MGDGVADDTQIFQAALDATVRGATFVPAGRPCHHGFHPHREERRGPARRRAGPKRAVLPARTRRRAPEGGPHQHGPAGERLLVRRRVCDRRR
ncbi:MAG: hypothetical protein H7343_11285 [Undibacterium sp.]|nr:hypothetical protein [Opitutaceae bacterium]